MSKTKRPRKFYKPRPANAAGGLSVIAKCYARGEDAAPLRPDQLTDLSVAYWLSMEQLRTGAALEEHWSCVVCALNIALALAEAGIGAEYEANIVTALDGAFRGKLRSAKTGNFRLDGEAMTAINRALEIHDAQIEAATRAEVAAAMVLVHDRINSGNVYREAA